MASPFPEPRDDQVRSLGLLALGSRLRRLSDHLMSEVAALYAQRGIDLEPRWFPLLRLLEERGPTAVGDAAAALGVSHAAVSQTAKALTRAGLVERREDPSDDRRRLLALTVAARRRLDGCQATWRDLDAVLGDVVGRTGVDWLAGLDALEHELRAMPLAERVRAAAKEREGQDVVIVPFRPALAEAFRRLNLEWLEQLFEVEPVDEELLADPQGHYRDAGGEVFFALLEDTPVGCVALLPAGPGRFELSKMAVTAGMRGKQIGRRLLEAALAWARDHGATTVELMTNSSLDAAVNLYRSAGFHVVRAGPHPRYQRCDLVMERDLRS